MRKLEIYFARIGMGSRALDGTRECQPELIGCARFADKRTEASAGKSPRSYNVKVEQLKFVFDSVYATEREASRPFFNVILKQAPSTLANCASSARLTPLPAGQYNVVCFTKAAEHKQILARLAALQLILNHARSLSW